MLRLIAVGLFALAMPALAQEGDNFTLFGGDAFGSGRAVTFAREGLDDVFGAGERVEVAAPIAGSAHLAGRRVTTGGDIGGDLVAFGADVTVGAPVAGSVTAAGYDVGLDAAVGGNVRAFGRTISVTAPIGGSALIAAATLTLDAAVTGDAAIDATSVTFGPAASVGGKLMLYGPDAGTVAVPGHVAGVDRIERHPAEAAPGPGTGTRPGAGPAGVGTAGQVGWVALATGFAVGVLVLAALAFLVALVAPRRADRMAAQIADEPLRTVWIGFLTLSALIGASVLAVLTIVGVLAVPVILLVMLVACFLGYLFAVYVIGHAAWAQIDHLPPDTVGERAIAALIGAAAVSLLGLVPFVGWPLLLLLTLAGLGALSIAVFRPEFGR